MERSHPGRLARGVLMFKTPSLSGINTLGQCRLWGVPGWRALKLIGNIILMLEKPKFLFRSVIDILCDEYASYQSYQSKLSTQHQIWASRCASSWNQWISSTDGMKRRENNVANGKLVTNFFDKLPLQSVCNQRQSASLLYRRSEIIIIVGYCDSNLNRSNRRSSMRHWKFWWPKWLKCI